MDHIIDPAAPQGAGHDHHEHAAHDGGFRRRLPIPEGGGHDHHHEHAHGAADYYLEQLLTIFICGAFGIVAILMFHFDMLKHILAPQFYTPVLIGGIGLLIVTAVRGVCLWRSVGGDHQHDHDHAHHEHKPGEECDHPSHAHEDADHAAEDHAHGNIYWRAIVLAFPIVLFLMGLPNKTFSKGYIDGRLGGFDTVGAMSDVAERGGEATYDFGSLSIAAASEDKRRALEGTPARIKGQLGITGIPDEFGLFYMKITCCATDAVPLKAIIKVDRPSLADTFKTKFKHHDWVEVSGVIQFVRKPNGEYITVLRIKDGSGIIPSEQVY